MKLLEQLQDVACRRVGTQWWGQNTSDDVAAYLAKLAFHEGWDRDSWDARVVLAYLDKRLHGTVSPEDNGVD